MDSRLAAYMKDTLGLDDPELQQEIYDEYLNTYRERLAAIKEAVAAKNPEALRMAAHSLKGCAANIGHQDAREPAYELEKAGKAGVFDQANELIAILDAKFAEVVDA